MIHSRTYIIKIIKYIYVYDNICTIINAGNTSQIHAYVCVYVCTYVCV